MMQTAPNVDEKNWGMYGHLSGMLAYSGIPFGGVIGPWVLYTQNRTQRPFAAEQARQALNFHITAGIVQVVAIVAAFVLYLSGIFTFVGAGKEATPSATGVVMVIGAVCSFLLYFAVYLFGLILTIVATVRASNGNLFTYPLTIPFVKGS